MMRVVLVTMAILVAAVVSSLATISGSIDAIAWALRTFGELPVLVTVAFTAGAIMMHAIDRGLAERRSQPLAS